MKKKLSITKILENEFSGLEKFLPFRFGKVFTFLVWKSFHLSDLEKIHLSGLEMFSPFRFGKVYQKNCCEFSVIKIYDKEI